MYRHLLVPVDGGDLSQPAVEGSIGLARKLGASITAIIVEPKVPLPSVGHGAVGYLQQMEKHDRETAIHAQRVMQSFQARAERAGVSFEGCFTRTDRVADAIVEVAAERGCDLIVMATHVHGLFGELFASSNTKRVMARCKLPLLVLHQKELSPIAKGPAEASSATCQAAQGSQTSAHSGDLSTRSR